MPGSMTRYPETMSGDFDATAARAISLEESANRRAVKAMLQEKRKDLDGERQKTLLNRLVSQLSRTEHDLYYGSASDVARRLERYIASEAIISVEDRALLKPLSQRDIQVLLSLN